jgi:hypothetical protein
MVPQLSGPVQLRAWSQAADRAFRVSSMFALAK